MAAFGFDKYEAELSTWDGGASGNYGGTADQWKLAEDALMNACNRLNIKAKVTPDEAAFYGPKIDVKLVDAIGRPWQLSTVQFDFNLPHRFEMEYVGEDGKMHEPVMVHRALYGSIERFFGILIEHYAGAFPVWLAPVQAAILPITDRAHVFSLEAAAQAKALGLRAELDLRNESLKAKIREAQLAKVPYMLVIGDREAEAGTVSVRHRHRGDLGVQPLAEFLASLATEVRDRQR